SWRWSRFAGTALDSSRGLIGQDPPPHSVHHVQSRLRRLRIRSPTPRGVHHRGPGSPVQVFSKVTSAFPVVLAAPNRYAARRGSCDSERRILVSAGAVRLRDFDRPANRSTYISALRNRSV